MKKQCPTCDGDGFIETNDHHVTIMSYDPYVEAEKITAYYKGQRDIVKLYAWWKDGVEYVGCGVKTLKEVLEEIETEEINELDNVKTL